MKQVAILFLLITFASVSVKAQLKIYGGKNYDQFLGCMTCDDDEPNSIWSPLSDYGSAHNAKSIWNKNGVYGSKKSNYSPYRVNAKYPPRVIDVNGKIVGYLTINKSNPNRLKGAVADLICDKRDMVLKDGVERYAKIFSKVN